MNDDAARVPETMQQDVALERGDSLVDSVAEWLMTQALGEGPVEPLVEACIERLRAAGIPLWRALVAFRTLHPLFSSISLVWRRGEGMATAQHQHTITRQSEAWMQSPLRHLLETDIPYLRRRLAGEGALIDFPVLEEFRDRGATDYLALRVPFGGDAEGDPLSEGLIATWTADSPGGFSDSDIRALIRIQRRLAVVCKVRVRSQIAHNVLATYLGPDAGRRVLNGQIKRGDGELIYAVIWYSDMRNSTAMADAMAPEAYLSALNAYFECSAGAVLAHGGEVLRLIGDAVLAIFPIRDGGATAEAACRAALAAAGEAQTRLVATNRERTSANLCAVGFGLGLHVGDVMFGNIGTLERLEFTVIGRAANEVARLESLTKDLDRPVVASAEFVTHLAVPWESLGRHDMKGVGEREVFAPPGR